MTRSLGLGVRLRLPGVGAATRKARLGVFVAAGLYAALFSVLTIRKQDTFHTTAYDLGIFDQAVWLLGHGLDPFVTVRGLNAFGDHFQPGLILLAPLGALDLGPDALLVAQSVGLALTAPLLFELARSRGASPRLSAAVALLWLASPLTHYVNLFDFHPEAFVPALLAAGALALERKRTWLFLAAAVVAASLKEDVSLLYLAWALVLALQGRRRLAAGLALGSVAWFLLATRLAIPAFGGDPGYYAARFGGQRTLTGLLYAMVIHPGHYLDNLASGTNARTLAALVASTGGLSLLAPVFLVAALPAVAANVLSDYGPQHTYVLHYHVLPAGVFAVAGALAAGRAEELFRRRRAEPLLWVGLLALAVAFVPFSPALDTAREVYGGKDAAAVAAKREAVRLVGGEASVAAQTDLVPHLAERRDVYTIPEPFLRREGAGWGDAELARRAARVRFVVLDDGELGTTPQEYARARRMLPRLGFVPVFRRAGVIVFERRGGPARG